MLVMEAPQFRTQDDFGFGDGISPVLLWQLASTHSEPGDSITHELDIDPAMENILSRLRNIFHTPRPSRLSNTDLHDLTCFVMHRLLLPLSLTEVDAEKSATSECLRYATALYMLTIHGTTYYSHVGLANSIGLRLVRHLKTFAATGSLHSPLGIWLLSVGMVATMDTADRQWLTDQARRAAVALGLVTWEDILVRLESVLWIRGQQGEVFRQRWEEVFKAMVSE